MPSVLCASWPLDFFFEAGPVHQFFDGFGRLILLQFHPYVMDLGCQPFVGREVGDGLSQPAAVCSLLSRFSLLLHAWPLVFRLERRPWLPSLRKPHFPVCDLRIRV